MSDEARLVYQTLHDALAEFIEAREEWSEDDLDEEEESRLRLAEKMLSLEVHVPEAVLTGTLDEKRATVREQRNVFMDGLRELIVQVATDGDAKRMVEYAELYKVVDSAMSGLP